MDLNSLMAELILDLGVVVIIKLLTVVIAIVSNAWNGSQKLVLAW